MKRGIVWAILLSLVGFGGLWTAHAATFNSSNFSINGNLGDSIAGGQNSTSYQLASAGGESIAGNSSSRSYKLGQGYIPTLENSMQVVTQPNGLAAYYPLDDTVPSGTALDESSNANNGIYEASSVSTPGKVGDAWADFNTTQYVTIPSSPSLPSGNKMTISGWIRKGGTAAQRAIITKWTYSVFDGSWAFQTTPSGDQLRMFMKASGSDDGSNYVDSTDANIANNTWYHVAMVYDGSLANSQRIKMYLNGNQLSTTVTGTIPTTITTSTHDMVIGEFPGLQRGWSGTIDEIKIYSRALSGSELKADYAATNTGIPAGLSLGDITPGTSQTSAFDSIVQTSAGGYSLGINQNNNLRTGSTGVSADFSQDFNGFTNGTALTTGNTGFNAVNSSNGGTFTASTSNPAHGAFGRFQTSAQSTASTQFDYGSTSSRYYRFYIRQASIPAATQTIFNLRDNAAGTVSAIRIQPDGTFQLRDGATTVATSAATLGANQWARVEMYYNAASSTQSVRLFTGGNLNGDVPSETITGSATNGATINANIGMVTGQASQTIDIDSVATSTNGWLGPTGEYSIPSVGGTIASPSAWSEGTTKGLGFTLYGTNATAIPGIWGSGSNYAAIPNSSSTFYSRTNYTGGAKDVLNMRLRLDVASNQQSGNYSNQVTIVGTMIP